jgi:uncharacterized membrane protein YjjB (DUF3815 family)
MWPLAFGPVFLLAPVFFLLYTLSIKKKSLIIQFLTGAFGWFLKRR